MFDRIDEIITRITNAGAVAMPNLHQPANYRGEVRRWHVLAALQRLKLYNRLFALCNYRMSATHALLFATHTLRLR